MHKLATSIHPCLNTAKVKQIIDKRGDVLNTILNTLDELLLIIIEWTSSFDKFCIPDYRGQRRTQIMRYRMHELGSNAIHLLQIGHILHGKRMSHTMDHGELGIANPAIRKTDFMILKGIVDVGKRDQIDQIWMCNYIKYRLANRSLWVESKRPTHRGVYQEN